VYWGEWIKRDPEIHRRNVRAPVDSIESGALKIAISECRSRQSAQQVLGVAALGAANLDTAFSLSAAIHALTAGAIGTMILAVMTRVTRGHTGRELTADVATTASYGLVILAAAVRVAAALDGDARALLLASAALWISAFGLFVVRYAPLALRPRIAQRDSLAISSVTRAERATPESSPRNSPKSPFSSRSV